MPKQQILTRLTYIIVPNKLLMLKHLILQTRKKNQTCHAGLFEQADNKLDNDFHNSKFFRWIKGQMSYKWIWNGLNTHWVYCECWPQCAYMHESEHFTILSNYHTFLRKVTKIHLVKYLYSVLSNISGRNNYFR